MNKDQNQDSNSSSRKYGMTSRGVSRPMARQAIASDDRGNGKMNRKLKLEMHHRETLWVYWLLVLFGFWMILSPLTFSYSKNVVQPSGGRELWLSLQERIAYMKWSDLLSGGLLLFFGWRSLLPGRPVSLWICCLVGVWLNLAPLVFWAPTSAIYINDTLIGTLVIALTILVPGMPNMIMYMRMGGEVPPGWSYNPSSWPQRWIMIVTGFAGWMVSRYLGAFQLGFIDEMWDPFFGKSSELVLNSKMSHSLPISDGALGALAYTFEFLMGWMGSPSRWRTMPWMVTFFGILVIPLGLVHIFLVISQPIVVGHWCTFCLFAAAIMLPMIPLEVDEVIAMGQHMRRSVKNGESFWKVFWKGGEAQTEEEDKRSPALISFPEKPGRVFKASIWGMSFPWTLIVTTKSGIIIMSVPGIFSAVKPVSNIFHLGGSLIVVFSVISMGEVLRTCRFLIIPLGIVVATVPWFLKGSNIDANLAGVIAGIIVVILSIPKGNIRESYGGWNKFVK